MLNNTSISPLPTHTPWSRDYLLSILQTALQVREYRFVRQTALQWLASYPGDLPVDLIHAQALLGEGRIQQAEKVAEKLCQRDPEYLEAQELLARAQIKRDPQQVALSEGAILVLEGKPRTQAVAPKAMDRVSEWVKPLQAARRALQRKDYQQAETQVQQALAEDPDTPLAAVTHLRIMSAQPDTPQGAIQNLAQHFHKRWPECVQFTLYLADALMGGGDSDQGVALLHKATVYDVTGQVAKRLWGPEHPYRSLWPKDFTVIVENPIPASVTAILGWNLLAAPTTQEAPSGADHPQDEIAPTRTSNQDNQPKTPASRVVNPSPEEKPIIEDRRTEIHQVPAHLPEALRSVQAELEQVGERLHRPGLARTDGRYPTYVILTTRRGLRAKYGRAGTAMLDASMRELAEAVRQQVNWGALLFYADDPACTTQLGIKPASADDPWALKLALADLDAALGKRGAMIGALLIVGGPQVVPFHHLPNPTDDNDTDVPSDNPYATRDENYFIPEWPVGRLPGGKGSHPGLLLSALQAISAYHTHRRTRTTGWWLQFWAWLKNFLRPGQKVIADSFGYSAEVWRKASLAVYQQIGGPGDLVTSPPLSAETRRQPSDLLLQGQLGYFNLHGLANTDEWYGQRDPINGSSGPDYPVALRVQDIKNSGSAPEIIFSEACYGAHIFEKGTDDSVALKFLESGSRVLVGSTVMSYGSISSPLNAADLLGIAFWKAIKEGHPAGEALRRAKIYLAREMHKRQGYLDGEDQKTLISFVLYGDPMAQPQEISRLHHKSKAVMRSMDPPAQVKTVCDRAEPSESTEPIPDEVMRRVKQVVVQYLPGMQDARMTLSHEHRDCNCEGHHCPTGQLGPKARPDAHPERRVVTLSKSIPTNEVTHPTYARLTLDKQGKVVKLAVSR